MDQSSNRHSMSLGIHILTRFVCVLKWIPSKSKSQPRILSIRGEITITLYFFEISISNKTFLSIEHRTYQAHIIFMNSLYNRERPQISTSDVFLHPEFIDLGDGDSIEPE